MRWLRLLLTALSLLLLLVSIGEWGCFSFLVFPFVLGMFHYLWWGLGMVEEFESPEAPRLEDAPWGVDQGEVR